MSGHAIIWVVMIYFAGEADGGEGRMDGETEEEANKKKHRRNR